MLSSPYSWGLLRKDQVFSSALNICPPARVDLEARKVWVMPWEQVDSQGSHYGGWLLFLFLLGGEVTPCPHSVFSWAQCLSLKGSVTQCRGDQQVLAKAQTKKAESRELSFCCKLLSLSLLGSFLAWTHEGNSSLLSRVLFILFLNPLVAYKAVTSSQCISDD